MNVSYVEVGLACLCGIIWIMSMRRIHRLEDLAERQYEIIERLEGKRPHSSVCDVNPATLTLNKNVLRGESYNICSECVSRLQRKDAVLPTSISIPEESDDQK